MPWIEVKSQKKRKKPPWWSNDVGNAKCEVNKAKKSFRRRRTPINFETLKKCEDILESVTEKAKREWTELICDRITYASSSKEMWENFIKLTSYEDYNRGGGGLPLLDENENPIFNREEKCQILPKIFFDGRHLANCSFDDKFKTDVENDLTTVTEENSKSNDAEEFFNYDISLNEDEAVIQHP